MTAERPDQFRQIPASLQDLAETLGPRVAAALIEHFGGVELRVPKAPAPDHPILKALGESDGRAVCRFLGGEKIYVPRGAHGGLWRAAQDLAAQGLSHGDIARRLGISQRWVRALINGGPPKVDRQGDLFDRD